MKSWKMRGLSAGLMAGTFAGLLDGALILNATPACADDTGTDTALIMGHALLPTPDASYVQEIMNSYIDPTPKYFEGQPLFPGYSGVGLYTPESDYGSGVTQGASDLDQAIMGQLGNGNPDGNEVVVFGYSMSTSVATHEIVNLDAMTTGAPSPSDLQFVLAENLNNPNGGIFTRFPELAGNSLPATPADTPYTVDNYTIEYSGASDFPQYASNLFADSNAAAGYFDLHPYLLPGWPAYFTASDLAGTVANPNVFDAATHTHYFVIPTQDLPLLDGLRDGPGAPSAFADMIQPDMRVLVDLGYNWTGDADVATPAEWTAPTVDTSVVDAYLEAGAYQGTIAELVDLNILPQSDLSALSDMYPYVPDVADLQSGALTATSDAVAVADATASLNALTSDLAASTSPLASELSTYLPGAAESLAGFFQFLASTL